MSEVAPGPPAYRTSPCCGSSSGRATAEWCSSPTNTSPDPPPAPRGHRPRLRRPDRRFAPWPVDGAARLRPPREAARGRCTGAIGCLKRRAAPARACEWLLAAGTAVLSRRPRHRRGHRAVTGDQDHVGTELGCRARRPGASGVHQGVAQGLDDVVLVCVAEPWPERQAESPFGQLVCHRELLGGQAELVSVVGV
jgi:hypothetical protein